MTERDKKKRKRDIEIEGDIKIDGDKKNRQYLRLSRIEN